jgi:AcrR family transcriptional regulator
LLEGGASFTELGAQRIADEAGVARSTFYLHYRDKTELIVRMAQELGGGAFALFAQWSPAGPDAVGALTASVRAVLRYWRERAHLLAAVLEVVGYDPLARQAWEARLDVFVTFTRGWLDAESRAGRTQPGLSTPTAARVMIWGGNEAVDHQILHGDPALDDEVAREIASLQWYGAFRRAGAG